ncbi:MAG: MerR family DNA-binding transcriptional regulator [Proteobacteria bacterium]|nr:MerR family DNA-binding transcriptional regulator [Pseudomonadota bacterium]MDA1057903.1 MerR family DNA-binding transcriptional regulator [Pseudomonadota bacterium]
MEESYTIQQLAKEFRVTSRTLRFYEAKDLLHPTRRGMNRVFGHRDRGRLKLILRGKRLGFSLAEIKEMLDLYDLGDGQVAQLRVTLEKSRRRIAELESRREDVDAAIIELHEGCSQIENILRGKGVGAKEAAE